MDQWTKIAPTVYAVLFAVTYYIYLHNHPVLLIRWIGMVLTAVGFAGWIVARKQLGGAFAINPQAKSLVTNGMYAKFKHPIYYSEILTFAGVAIFLLDPLVLAAVAFLFVVLLYRMREEERVLAAIFGQEYELHRRSVWF